MWVGTLRPPSPALGSGPSCSRRDKAWKETPGLGFLSPRCREAEELGVSRELGDPGDPGCEGGGEARRVPHSLPRAAQAPAAAGGLQG